MMMKAIESIQMVETVESNLQDLATRFDLLIGFQPLEEDGPGGRIGHHQPDETHLREEEGQRNAQTFAVTLLQ